MQTKFVIPSEATHSSLSLEFQVVGERNNLIDLQKIYGSQMNTKC